MILLILLQSTFFVFLNMKELELSLFNICKLIVLNKGSIFRKM